MFAKPESSKHGAAVVTIFVFGLGRPVLHAPRKLTASATPVLAAGWNCAQVLGSSVLKPVQPWRPPGIPKMLVLLTRYWTSWIAPLDSL